MAGASVSEMVLFIAGIVVAASVAGTLVTQVDRFNDAIDSRSLDVAEDVRTDVTVISDPGAQVYNRSGANNVTLYVRNTGSESLPGDGSKLDVLFDGGFVGTVSVTVVEGGPGWSVGGVIEVEFDAGSLDPGTDHRVQVIVNDDEEVFEFRTDT